MSKRPRSMKIQEFYAHTGAINSVSIGRKSAAVIATGADDQLVNIWKLGKTKPVMSLSGHTTEVDCVLFDVKELFVVGGSRGGTIKLWDLTQASLIRTHSGHRSGVTSFDWHPYGEYFASGSVDSNVKIFDPRKKEAIQTYKGHQAPITALKHSPDGRWLVSGDAQGVMKVWDLTTGKVISELKQTSSTKEKVVALDFHPNEFLLSVTGEHAIHFWDMENFVHMAASPLEGPVFRAGQFSLDGRGLLSASGGSLKSWTWEPEVQVVDMMDVGWGAGGGGGGGLNTAQILADMAESPSPTGRELIGVTRMKTVLGIFICDLTALKPFDQIMEGEEVEGEPSSSAAAANDSREHQSLMETMERISLQSQEPLVPSSSSSSLYDQPSQPSSSNPLPTSSPTKSSILDKPHTSFFQAHAGAPNGVHIAVPSKPNPFQQPTTTKPTAAPSSSSQFQAATPTITPAPQSTTTTDQGTSMTRRDSVPLTTAASMLPALSAQLSSQLPASRFPPSLTSPTNAASPSPIAPLTSPTTTSVASSVPSTSSSSTTSTTAAPVATPTSSATLDLEAHRRKVLEEHAVMVKILTARARALTSLQAAWKGQQYKKCFDDIVKIDDQAVTNDFLTSSESAFTTGGILTLDLARDLLPICKKLLMSKFEPFAMTGLRYIKLLLVQFTPVIQNCRATGAVVSSGVDLTRDERLARANDCFNLFKSIYDQSIATLAKKQTPVGELARETRSHLEKLLWTTPTIR